MTTTAATNTTNQWGIGAPTGYGAKANTATARTEEEKKTDSALKGLGDNFQHFLKLLTTQMQNQDPLKPMDTNEMTNQLVQFANVEQNIATNSRLDKMLKLQNNNAAASNLSYLGREVEFEGKEIELKNGKAEFRYELLNQSKETTIEIVDSRGVVVRSAPGETKPGTKYPVAWTGYDDVGNKVPDGTYQVRVVAKGKMEDEIVLSKSYVTGKVTGVDTTTVDNPNLNIGLLTVPMNKITAVK